MPVTIEHPYPLRVAMPFIPKLKLKHVVVPLANSVTHLHTHTGWGHEINFKRAPGQHLCIHVVGKTKSQQQEITV